MNNETTGRGATTALSQLQQYVWSGPQLSGLKVADQIAHVRYIKILTWLQGIRAKLEIFYHSIISQFEEEIWAERMPTQKRVLQWNQILTITIGPGFAHTLKVLKNPWILK